MLLEDGEPIIDGVPIPGLNRGEVALRASYLVTHRPNPSPWADNSIARVNCTLKPGR